MAELADDLDELLDSALDDFSKIDLGTSERIKDAINSKQNEQMPSSARGLGIGLPELRVKKKGKKNSRRTSHVTETLEKLTQETREVVRGLESTTVSQRDDLPNEEMMENFVKMFEELAGSQDMESMVESMMHELLSRDTLHEPMKEIGEKYPKWLEQHKCVLSKEDYDRYYRQYQLINMLNEVYETDSGNFPKIVELMQKMQDCGQPPNDIVREIAPDLDLTALGDQIPSELLQTNSTTNCCIM